MTFTLAVITPDLALAAGDTRVRFYADGALAGYEDGWSKILPVEGAWLTGGSPLHWVADSILKGRRIEGEKGALRDAMRHLPPGLRCRYSGVDCAWVVQLARDPKGWRDCFAIYALDFTTPRVGYWSGTGFDYATPGTDGDDETEAWCWELAGVYKSDVMEGRLAPYDLIRRTARLYREVYAICGPEGSVSEDVEMGLLRRDGPGNVELLHIPATSSACLAAASDDELTALARPLAPGESHLPVRVHTGAPADLIPTLQTGTLGSIHGNRCKVYFTADYNTPGESVQIFPWDAEAFDVGDLHDLVTNPERITIRYTGLYSVVFRAQYSSLGVATLRLKKNGGTKQEHIFLDGAATGELTLSITEHAVPGDYFEADVLLDIPGTNDMTLYGGDESKSSLTVTQVGGSVRRIRGDRFPLIG